MAIVAYYGVLPAKVRYNEKLKDSEKLLYCELAAMSGTGGYCILDMEYLKKFTGCTEATIAQYLDSLEKCGFIKRYDQADGRTKIYLRDGK